MAFYNRGKHMVADPTVGTEAPLNFTADVIKAALMKTSYTANVDTHEQFDDIVASEIVATSYTSRGNALASKTLSRVDASDRIEFDAADLVFTAIGGATDDTFDTVVLLWEMDSSPTNANSELVAYAATNPTTTNGGNITLTWSANGILHFG